MPKALNLLEIFWDYDIIVTWYIQVKSLTHRCLLFAFTKDVNKDEQNRRFCWPTSQLILMLGILIGGRFWDFKCLIWNFLIWKQQNLHIKENDQHLVQLLPNKLVTPFIIVLLVSINVFVLKEWTLILIAGKIQTGSIFQSQVRKMILIAKLGIMGEGVCEDQRLYDFD